MGGRDCPLSVVPQGTELLVAASQWPRGMQPFFQSTPAQLASAWFPVHERTLALTIAFNSSVFGVALSFLVGTSAVKAPDELPPYLMVRAAPPFLS